MFADDTKVFKAISTIQDAEDLQADIDRLALWAKTWQLPYNELKCKTIHYGKNNTKHNYKMNGYDLITDLEEKRSGCHSWCKPIISASYWKHNIESLWSSRYNQTDFQ